MLDRIIGLPGGMAVRHLGFDPVDWQDRMALRAAVVRGLDEAAGKGKARRKRAARPRRALSD